MEIPSSDDILSDPVGHRRMYYKLHASLNDWSKRNLCLLQELTEKNEFPFIEPLQNIYDKWFRIFISEYGLFGQMKVFGNIRTCPAVQIFTELSRTHFLLMYKRIFDETQESLKRGHPEGLIAYSMDKSEHYDGDFGLDWKKPIITYTQQEIMNGLLMLTEKMDQMPLDAMDELKHILLLLYTRNSVLFCETNKDTILNVNGMIVPVSEGNYMPNRDYFTFTTIYFHTIQRRVFFYDITQKCDLDSPLPKGSIERTEQWIEEIAESLGSEGYEDCYSRSCEEAYVFPGDREWFCYRFPDMPIQTGPILDCFRKNYSRSYYSEYRTSKESVFAVVNQTSHAGHCARFFVLNCVDHYMRTQLNLPWRDGFVIENGAIEGTKIRLFRNHAPYMLQLCSRFWVYHNGKIIPRDNIFESLAIWLYICKTHYQSKVFGISIAPVIEKIIDNAQKKTFTAAF